MLLVTVDLLTEPSEDLVIEHFRDFEQLGIDKLQTAISSAHMITDAYSETLDSAANDRKKLEVIVAALSHMVKQQLIIFLKDLKSEMMPRAEGINLPCRNCSW